MKLIFIIYIELIRFFFERWTVFEFRASRCVRRTTLLRKKLSRSQTKQNFLFKKKNENSPKATYVQELERCTYVIIINPVRPRSPWGHYLINLLACIACWHQDLWRRQCEPSAYDKFCSHVAEESCKSQPSRTTIEDRLPLTVKADRVSLIVRFLIAIAPERTDRGRRSIFSKSSLICDSDF